MYKSTFYILKIGSKNRPRLVHVAETEIKKIGGQIVCVAIVYLKENSRIKDEFFWLQNGGSTYTGDQLTRGKYGS